MQQIALTVLPALYTNSRMTRHKISSPDIQAAHILQLIALYQQFFDQISDLLTWYRSCAYSVANSSKYQQSYDQMSYLIPWYTSCAYSAAIFPASPTNNHLTEQPVSSHLMAGFEASGKIADKSAIMPYNFPTSSGETVLLIRLRMIEYTHMFIHLPICAR